VVPSKKRKQKGTPDRDLIFQTGRSPREREGKKKGLGRLQTGTDIAQRRTRGDRKAVAKRLQAKKLNHEARKRQAGRRKREKKTLYRAQKQTGTERRRNACRTAGSKKKSPDREKKGGWLEEVPRGIKSQGKSKKTPGHQKIKDRNVEY